MTQANWHENNILFCFSLFFCFFVFCFSYLILKSVHFFSIHSAVKCNDSPIVIQTLANLGTGFDCASKGEIAKVMNYGVAPQSIIYANPTKPISHLKFASEMNVSVMTVDSDFELHKIKVYYPNAR